MCIDFGAGADWLSAVLPFWSLAADLIGAGVLVSDGAVLMGAGRFCGCEALRSPLPFAAPPAFFFAFAFASALPFGLGDVPPLDLATGSVEPS